MSTIELQVSEHFPPGTEVEAHPRVSDAFVPGATKAVAKAKVGKDGTVKLAKLVEHGPYFLAGEIKDYVPDARAEGGVREIERWQAIAVTANDPTPALNRDQTNEQARLEAEAAAEVAKDFDPGTAPSGGTTARAVPGIVEGARSTENVLPVRIEGVEKGTPLASHTSTGEAVIVGEPPRRQEDIEDDTPQSSSTETGAAAVIEEVPKQEDVKGEPQASDTETGVATTTEAHLPKPDAGETTARKTGALRDLSSKASPKKKGARPAKKAAKKR